MKKNKGFIATSILFGIVALLFITFAIILGNSHASLKSGKVYGNMLKAEITNLSGIRLHPNGGYIKNKLLEVDFNGTYEGLPDSDSDEKPVREGYLFTGWCTKPDCEADGGTPVEANTSYQSVKANVLYAQWSKNKYALIIDPKDGKYVDGEDVYSAPRSYPLYYDEQKEISKPTRYGYVFEGWELTGTGSKFDGSIFQMGYENALLTAKWKKNEVTLTVDPSLGTWGESSNLQEFKLKYEDKIQIPDPVRDGYTFTGWTMEEETATLSGTTLTMGVNDVLLTANWEINNYPYLVKHYQQAVDNDTYTLFESNTDEAKFGSIIDVEYNDYEGFQAFVRTDENGKEILEKITITSDSTKNTAEYRYNRILYLLKIDPNNGVYSGETEKYLRYEATHTLNTPTRTGYTFSEWTTTSGTLNNNIFKISASDATVTANWIANEYTLTLESTGGYPSTMEYSVFYDSKYGTFEEPTRVGYTFKGWSTTSDGKNIIDSNTIVKTASDHTLYAVWEANKYTVNLYPRGGTVSPTSITVTFDDTYKDLPTPTKNKHEFYGWFTDETAGKEIKTEDTVLITEDINLYARWIPTDAEFIQYSNSTYTTCNNVACTLDELYSKFK